MCSVPEVMALYWNYHVCFRGCMIPSCIAFYFVLYFMNRKKTRLLWRQKYACRNKTVVATKLCYYAEQIFVATNTCLSRQMFCHDKHTFVARKVSLSRQTYFCHNKRRVLSRQTRVCHNKTFSCDKNDTCGSSRQ